LRVINDITQVLPCQDGITGQLKSKDSIFYEMAQWRSETLLMAICWQRICHLRRADSSVPAFISRIIRRSADPERQNGHDSAIRLSARLTPTI
jgi:hypothetical protein